MDEKRIRGIIGETLIPVTEAGKHIPGKHRSLSCIDRWTRAGLNGVRLESRKIGGIRYTSHEAIDRFLEATDREPGSPIVAEPMVPTLPIRTPEETERQLAEIFAPKKRGPKSAADRGADE